MAKGLEGKAGAHAGPLHQGPWKASYAPGGIWTWKVSINDQHATTVATEHYSKTWYWEAVFLNMRVACATSRRLLDSI